MSNYYYSHGPEDTDAVEYEVKCNWCHGSGIDRDEADCIKCEGYGTLIEYY